VSAGKATRRPKARSTSPSVLEERLEYQRQRIFQVTGICHICSSAAAAVEEGTEEARKRFAEHAWSAMELAASMLYQIAGDLDPVRILKHSEKPAEGQPS